MRIKVYVIEVSTRVQRRLISGAIIAGIVGVAAVCWASVPNTFKDGDVLTAQALNDNFKAAEDPSGVIVAYAGDPAHLPPGWLLCDGAPVDRTTFADLFAAIGTTWGSTDSQHFNVPDLRGRFLRGLGGGDPDCATRVSPATGGVAAGCSVGTLQADAVASHSHGLSIPASGSGTTTIVDTLSRTNNNGGTVPYTTQATGGAESRPKNAAVGFIIKI